MLLVAGAFPVVLLVAATTRGDPRPTIERQLPERLVRRGDSVTMDLVVTLPRGRYAVEVHQPLPGAFDLQLGSNVHVLAADPRVTREHHVRLVLRALQRGGFTIPPVRWERVGLAGLEAPRSGDACGAVHLEVAPAGNSLPTGKRVHVRAGEDTGPRLDRLGLSGSDFTDLREYVRGDPPKSINWKATARRMTTGASANPLVNEFEREGKRSVVIVVDASARLDVGVEGSTALDAAVDAAAGLGTFLLERGHRVGAWVAGGRNGDRVVHPDTGRAHAGRVSRAFLNAQASDGASTLARAVERVSAFSLGGSGLLVVFTRVADPADDLLSAVSRARHALRVPHGSTQIPVVVVDVRPLGLSPGDGARVEDARRLLDALDAPARQAVRRAGATVIEWAPDRGSFANAFLKGVRA